MTHVRNTDVTQVSVSRKATHFSSSLASVRNSPASIAVTFYQR